MDKVPLTVKRYSKENSQSERDKLAVELRAIRSSYFERAEQIRKLEKDKKDYNASINDIQTEMRDIYLEYQRLSNSILNRLFNKNKIRELSINFGSRQRRLKDFQASHDEIKADLKSLRSSQQQRRELNKAIEKRGAFYEGQSKEMADEAIRLEKERQERTISSVVESLADWKSIYFVHGINPSYVPGGNSLLRDGTDWKEKLRVLLALNPHLSVSSIREGDNCMKMWSWMGVLLKEGEITYAKPGDGATVAQSIGKRKQSTSSFPSQWDIQRAIGHSSDYNEFNVVNSQVAGYYVIDGFDFNNRPEKYVPISEIYQFAHIEMGLPIYIIRQGELYTARLDEEDDAFVPVGNKIRSLEVVNSNFDIDTDAREKALAGILEDCPFKLGFFDDAKNLMAVGRGREMYFELNSRWVEQNCSGMVESFVTVPKRRLTYVVENQRLVKNVQNHDESESKHFVSPAYRRGVGSLIMVDDHTYNMGRNISGNTDYFKGMTHCLSMHDVKRKQAADGAERELDRFYKVGMERLAYHLYGFANQAERLNGVELKERALNIATNIVSQERYCEVLEKLGLNGEFRMSSDDLRLLSD